MNDELLTRLRRWIAEGRSHEFYRTKEWRRKRKEILKRDKYECQWCKAKGIYEKANTVHHVQYLDKHPELGLSDYHTYKGKQHRQLISVCRECHEKHHQHGQKPKEPLTKERW